MERSIQGKADVRTRVSFVLVISHLKCSVLIVSAWLLKLQSFCPNFSCREGMGEDQEDL